MLVAVLHNRVAADAPADERDVLAQVAAVSAALARLGHRAEALACDLDLGEVAAELDRRRPDVVFNLVEGLGGHERLLHLAPALLDVLGLPYTGCPTEAVFLTTGKLLAKERLAAAGLPTPAWLTSGAAGLQGEMPAAGRPGEATRFIVKPVWEHGSVGMEDEAVVAGGDLAALARRLGDGTGSGGPLFAEAYVDGREFNLSLLAAGGSSGVSAPPISDSPISEPEVLPPAEILFTDYPEGKPRIVGYRAKWEEGSFEYHHTPRRFDFPAEDQVLLDEVARLARRCWHLFGLRGYARVDFRVDAAGRPWILEVNTNPCISPDAGFAAALDRAGIAYDEAVGRILADIPGVSASAAPQQ